MPTLESSPTRSDSDKLADVKAGWTFSQHYLCSANSYHTKFYAQTFKFNILWPKCIGKIWGSKILEPHFWVNISGVNILGAQFHVQKFQGQQFWGQNVISDQSKSRHECIKVVCSFVTFWQFGCRSCWPVEWVAASCAADPSLAPTRSSLPDIAATGEIFFFFFGHLFWSSSN